VSEVLALVALIACLASAIARPRWAPDWVLAPVAGAVLLLSGALSAHQAGSALRARTDDRLPGRAAADRRRLRPGRPV
jgi:hypothetical protein